MGRRLLFFSKHKRRTLYSISVIRALRRLGCTVVRVNTPFLRRNLGERLADRFTRQLVLRFKPDGALIFSGDVLDATLDWMSGRLPTGLLLDDYFPIDHPVTEKARKVDCFFHTMTGMLDEYRAAGVKRPVYVHSGVDPDLHRRAPSRRSWESDVAFIGKAIYEDRIRLVRSLAARLDVKVYGRGWRDFGVEPFRDEVGQRGFRRVCSSSRVVVGIDKTADRELYFSNRTWFVLGCGGFLVTRYVPGLERLFANHEHLVWFRDEEEAAELCEHYLARPEERRAIAESGYRFAHDVYPFDRMAENMLGALFEGRDPRPLSDPGPSREVDLAAARPG